MAKLKKIGVLSLAKFEAILMALVGLIFGVFYAILGTIIGVISSLPPRGLSVGLGFLAIIIIPILYAIFGFIAGAIGAYLYNLIAGWIGGIEIELEK